MSLHVMCTARPGQHIIPVTCDICKLCCAAGLSLEIFKISYGADCVLQPFLIYSIETHVTLHGFPIP